MQLARCKISSYLHLFVCLSSRLSVATFSGVQSKLRAFVANARDPWFGIETKEEVMARMRKPGWSPCEEFKVREKKTSAGSDEVRTTRVKTLAKAAKSEVPQVKADLKSKLPVLTAVEVRRYRIPYYESVVLELDEEGFRDAAEYLSMLFELDEEMRRKAGPGSIVWKKPRLRNQKNFLERLRSGLTAAEVAKRSGKLLIQAASLLDMALFFESTTWEWFWIAEQLFRSSLKIAENVENDEGQTLNVIRYLYGRFLFNHS